LRNRLQGLEILELLLVDQSLSMEIPIQVVAMHMEIVDLALKALLRNMESLGLDMV